MVKILESFKWLFSRKMTVKYSYDDSYYYVLDLVCGHGNWISTKKYDSMPNYNKGWEYVLQYDNSYYRIVKPFVFWSIKSGKEEKASKDSDLVKDYVCCGRHKKGLK